MEKKNSSLCDLLFCDLLSVQANERTIKRAPSRRAATAERAVIALACRAGEAERVAVPGKPEIELFRIDPGRLVIVDTVHSVDDAGMRTRGRVPSSALREINKKKEKKKKGKDLDDGNKRNARRKKTLTKSYAMTLKKSTFLDRARRSNHCPDQDPAGVAMLRSNEAGRMRA
jgi:hypothetical protein